VSATRVQLASTGHVGARPEGGFIFEDQYGVFRVLPDGTFAEILNNRTGDQGFTTIVADDGFAYRRGFPRGRIWRAWPG
jgi:hypothetical protein